MNSLLLLFTVSVICASVANGRMSPARAGCYEDLHECVMERLAKKAKREGGKMKRQMKKCGKMGKCGDMMCIKDTAHNVMKDVCPDLPPKPTPMEKAKKKVYMGMKKMKMMMMMMEGGGPPMMMGGPKMMGGDGPPMMGGDKPPMMGGPMSGKPNPMMMIMGKMGKMKEMMQEKMEMLCEDADAFMNCAQQKMSKKMAKKMKKMMKVKKAVEKKMKRGGKRKPSRRQLKNRLSRARATVERLRGGSSNVLRDDPMPSDKMMPPMSGADQAQMVGKMVDFFMVYNKGHIRRCKKKMTKSCKKQYKKKLKDMEKVEIVEGMQQKIGEMKEMKMDMKEEHCKCMETLGSGDISDIEMDAKDKCDGVPDKFDAQQMMDFVKDKMCGEDDEMSDMMGDM